MIAASNDAGACGVGDTSCTDGNFVAMFTECCDLRGEQERCNSWEGSLFFPRQNCDFVGIALVRRTQYFVLVLWLERREDRPLMYVAVALSLVWKEASLTCWSFGIQLVGLALDWPRIDIDWPCLPVGISIEILAV